MDNTKGKILLVDDEVNTLRVLSAILRRHDYEVSTARTAEEGLDRTSKTDFDLVITDHKLPGMNGADFHDRLKQRSAGVPVIMLTAYGSIEKAVDAMRRGAFSY